MVSIIFKKQTLGDKWSMLPLKEKSFAMEGLPSPPSHLCCRLLGIWTVLFGSICSQQIRSEVSIQVDHTFAVAWSEYQCQEHQSISDGTSEICDMFCNADTRSNINNTHDFLPSNSSRKIGTLDMNQIIVAMKYQSLQ